ncbi:hypothetical protein Taro_024241 [Colocasia esculenta]|uniref:RING-type domain-containing protein n=1 Tax=Colocasia esculenta TaxID=4460 RepID=A0A843VAR6_COLES|nr:hypothetical protein [Colocasia esculenta]
MVLSSSIAPIYNAVPSDRRLSRRRPRGEPPMGLNGARDRALRHGRRARPSARPHHHHHHPAADVSMPTAFVPHPPPSSSAAPPGHGGFLDCDDAPPAAAPGGWGYCTEEQLEELLLRNLDLVYREALAKLAALGYDEDLALRAVLRNGHCYGSMDALSNILHNALAHISSSAAADSDGGGNSSAAFSDLRHLVEYSLAGMVCLLQQVKPHLTRGDAMWCLLMSDLHVGSASTIDVPPVPPAFVPCGDDFPDGGSGGEIEAECARRFGLPPSLESLLKRNVAVFAAGYRARSKPSAMPAATASQRGFFPLKHNYEDSAAIGVPAAKDSTDSDIVASVLSDLEKLNIEEEDKAPEVPSDDQKKDMIMDLIQEIRELEGQVKERMEWAHQKALQAARKLSSDLTEMRMLRMEREETLKAKNVRHMLDDATIMRLENMEDALRKASGEVDKANELVHRLEIENKELRAEMAASKLSASESALVSMEVAKREKKCMKRLATWEKQKAELQEKIAQERTTIEQMQLQLIEIGKEQKELKAKWRQEVKAKEQAIALVEDARVAKEAADASIKRRYDALHRKIEIDFQRHKDDIQRLEDELARLKTSADSGPFNSPSPKTFFPGDPDGAKAYKDVHQKVPHAMLNPQQSSKKVASHHRECVICKNDEVSVVFLPCAHQVLCADCNEDHEKRSRACCPRCSFRIDHRIRVFGVSA